MSGDSIRLGLQTLAANPMRTTLSTLGIIMGAGSLAAVLSLGDGAERFARTRLEQEGMQAVVLTTKTFDLVDGQRIPRLTLTTLDADAVAALAGLVGSTHSVSFSRSGTVRWQSTADGSLRAAALVGRLSAGAASSRALASGRDLTAAELRDGAAVGVVSAPMARAITGAGPSEAVGREILASGRTVRIVGVWIDEAQRRALELTVPDGLATAIAAPSRDPMPPAIMIRAASVEQVPELRRRVEDWARTRYGDGVAVASRGLDLLRDLAQGILVFKLVMGAFTAISLIVGGIGIMNVLLASVLERTREIGVRKAVGARRRDLLVQFLVESMTIATVGSLTGLLLGLAAAYATTAIIRARTQALIFAAASWETVVVSIAAALVTGVVFGLYPALRAARLSPVDAMRHE